MLRKYLLNLAPDISPDGIPSGGASQQVILEAPDAGTPMPEPTGQATPQVEQQQDKGTSPVYEEAEGEEAFSMDAFLKAKQSTDDTHKEVIKPVEKKEDEVIDDKAISIPADKKVTQPIVDKNNKTDARDYSDIPDEDKPVFKKMGNEAFAKFKPIYLAEKEKTKLLAERDTQLAEAKKGGLPENYFENPEAYIFDPEYKQAEQHLNIATSVANHWREQMTLIEKGKEWQDLNWDEAQKKFIKSAPIPSSPENRIAVQEAFQNVLNKRNEFESKAQSIRNNFQQRNQQVNEELGQLADSCFPTFKDAKSEHHLIAKDIESKLPNFIRKSPLSKIITRSMAVNLMLSKQLAELKKNGAPANGSAAKTTNGVSAAKRQAGPTNGDMGASSQVTLEQEVTMDDFRRVKEGY